MILAESSGNQSKFWSAAHTVLEVAKAVGPMFLGIATLVVLLQHSYVSEGEGPDFSKTAFAHRGPYQASVFAQCVFSASVIVTIIGTLFYVSDLHRCSKLLAGKSGQGRVDLAFYLTIATVVVSLGIIAVVAGIKGPDIGDYAACTYHGVQDEFTNHVYFVCGIFLAFIAIDVLTWLGMRDAAKALQGEDAIRANSSSKFAFNQIWLVDVPVLFGGGLSYFLMNLPQQANAKILQMDPGMFALAEKGAACKYSGGWMPMSTDGFAEMITNLFLSGISSGYLAAHVVMSQLVFVVLSVLSARELKKHLKDYRESPAAKALTAAE